MGPFEPGVEARVVREDRLDPHHDDRELGAQGLDVRARDGPADPLALARLGRDLAVHGHGHLHDDEGQPGADVLEEDLVEAPGLVGADAPGHLHPGGRQDGDRLRGRQGVGILDGEDHPRDAGGDQGLGAGAGAAPVVAGLEGHVGGGAPGAIARRFEGEDLGVRLAQAGVVPLAHHLAILDDHRPHHGVGRGPARALMGQFEGAPHPALVLVGCDHLHTGL
ncbi:hypothetical protein D3C86_1622270 [compost metagenome]